MPSAPQEPYYRIKHYGRTPTPSDRKVLAAKQGEEVDLTIPLVRHYYEGDGSGGKRGFEMTNKERKEFANNRKNMTVKPGKQNRSEGGSLQVGFS